MPSEGMRFDLDGLAVFWPYPSIYPEQYDYCLELKKALDAKGHGLIEMPTGTGKTVCILATACAYRFAHPDTGKLVYCTRTVPEMQKTLEELKEVINTRTRLLNLNKHDVLALCLSSRRNMCINDGVMSVADRENVDRLCRQRTVTFEEDEAQHERCDFYDEYALHGSDADIPSGIYTLKDIKQLGRSKNWCPYFLTRHLIEFADVVVFNYQYMLDPKIANLVSKELSKESVVVFDEAHNIDNVCIEALSVEFNERGLSGASRNVSALKARVSQARQVDKKRLQEEYSRLVEGLQLANVANGPADLDFNDVFTEEITKETVPGAIRKAENFIELLDSVLSFLKAKMSSLTEVESLTPTAFGHAIQSQLKIEAKSLKFCYTRLGMLLRTLKIVNLDDFAHITRVANFLTLVSTPEYKTGFVVVSEPHDPRTPFFKDPKLQLACLDASIAMKPVLDRFQTVVITSGTLSPIDLYPKLLHFEPVVSRSLGMSVSRACICPLVVVRGSDQNQLSSSYSSRGDPSVMRNYGTLLLELVKHVPDGVVVFFPSYDYLEKAVAAWDSSGLLDRVMAHKLIYIETKDVVETSLALENFRRSCDAGRGALFLSIARGKVSEGVDFDGHYGRCVVLIGIPFQYTKSRVLEQRLLYLRTTFGIKDTEFLAFDALRQTAQCIGRVIRSKSDWGVTVLADARYAKPSKRNKLPPWITQFLEEKNLDLSIEDAVRASKAFLRSIAQPVVSTAPLLGPKELEEMRIRRLADQSEQEGRERLKRSKTEW